MLGPADYVLWIAGALLDALVVVCALKARAFWKYFPLNFYMLAAVGISIGRFFCYSRYGFDSAEYFYFYFYSDALLVICLYFAMMGLFSNVFSQLGAGKYVRIAAVLLLGGTAAFSYGVVQQSRDMMLTKLVVELAQNLNFVGVVLSYLLWASIMKLQVTKTRLVQMALAVGVYFSAFAANFALHGLYPNLNWIWAYFPPVMALWLPLAWSYTFWKVSEDAQLATARLVARPR